MQGLSKFIASLNRKVRVRATTNKQYTIEHVEAIPYENMWWHQFPLDKWKGQNPILDSSHVPTSSFHNKIQDALTSALHPVVDPPVVGVHTVALILAPQLSILLGIGQRPFSLFNISLIMQPLYTSAVPIHYIYIDMFSWRFNCIVCLFHELCA